MSVRIKATPFLPEMFGEIVDMPTPMVYVIHNAKNGFVTVHDVEIVEFFYS